MGIFTTLANIAFGIADSSADKAIGKRRYGENADYRISDSTRAALNAAKIRAGDIGSTDQQRASSQAALANMETGIGFMTDYGKLDTVSNETGIDITGAGRNVSEGIANSNALAGLRYEGSDQYFQDISDAGNARATEGILSIGDMFGAAAMGGGGMGGGELEQPGTTTIDNNFGMSTPEDAPLVIDNNYGMSTPDDAPEYDGSTGYSPSGVFKDIGGATNVIDNNQPETGSYSWDNSGILGQPVMADKMNIPSIPDNSGYSLVNQPSYPQAEGSHFKDYQKQPDIIPQMLSVQRGAERFPEIPSGYFNDIRPMSAPEQKYGSYESIFSPSSVIEPLGQRQPKVESTNQQDIVSMLLKLLQTKEIPRA